MGSVVMKKAKYDRMQFIGRFLRVMTYIGLALAVALIEKDLGRAVVVALVSIVIFPLGDWLVVRGGGTSIFSEEPIVSPVAPISNRDLAGRTRMETK